MGFTTAQFYVLTYCELTLILEGYRDRQKTALRRTREESAWIVSWLMLPHKSKDADAEVFSQAWLLGRKPRRKAAGPRTFDTMEESVLAWQAAQRAKSEREAKHGK